MATKARFFCRQAKQSDYALFLQCATCVFCGKKCHNKFWTNNNKKCGIASVMRSSIGRAMLTRRLEDRGGGLARVNGHLRLVEGLANPREQTEFELTFYNSNTCWIHLDKLLQVFGLTRAQLADETTVTSAIRAVAARMPTYITLKDVKKRWGHGQEDIFPVAQFEKLWVDMTSLPEVACKFVAVPRLRGQQLKDQAQLEGWLRDGSADYVERLCEWK